MLGVCFRNQTASGGMPGSKNVAHICREALMHCVQGTCSRGPGHSYSNESKGGVSLLAAVGLGAARVNCTCDAPVCVGDEC